MSSRQRDLQPLDEAPEQTEAHAPFALKEQVAQRLADHRSRRTPRQGSPAASMTPPASASPRASRIADVVRERYAHSQSYRAFLAEQAEAAIRAAEAAAELARQNAQAVADAQYKLLDELDHWTLTPPPLAPQSPIDQLNLEAHAASSAPFDSSDPRIAASLSPAAGLTVRLFDADRLAGIYADAARRQNQNHNQDQNQTYIQSSLQNQNQNHTHNQDQTYVQSSLQNQNQNQKKNQNQNQNQTYVQSSLLNQNQNQNHARIQAPSQSQINPQARAKDQSPNQAHGQTYNETRSQPQSQPPIYSRDQASGNTSMHSHPQTQVAFDAAEALAFYTAEALALEEAEALALEDEIAFRQSPIFEDLCAPVDIPANLIEFPRQLVAPRRARPRLAEGPLREEADQSAEAAQLRIFEVEAAQISTAPALESAAPEWSSILLAAQPVSAVVEVPEAPFHQVFSPQTASFSLRLMAAVVDLCILTAALLAFTAAFAFTVSKLDGPVAAATAGSRIALEATAIAASALSSRHTLETAAITAAVTFAVFTLLYQLLFFTFSEATPGMRYARIALCTFSDDNPTRSAMRRRILATVLSACPLGIGFLWAWLDEDGLGWHDRISRMYQRSY